MGFFGSSRGGRGDGGELGPVGLAGVEQDAPVCQAPMLGSMAAVRHLWDELDLEGLFRTDR